MDEEFELGNEPAGAVRAACPYCGETVEILIDQGGGSHQSFVEDCEVCCQPWNVTVQIEPDGSASVSLTAEDG